MNNKANPLSYLSPPPTTAVEHGRNYVPNSLQNSPICTPSTSPASLPIANSSALQTDHESASHYDKDLLQIKDSGLRNNLSNGYHGLEVATNQLEPSTTQFLPNQCESIIERPCIHWRSCLSGSGLTTGYGHLEAYMHHIVGLGSPAQATSPTGPSNGSFCGHLAANNGTRGRPADGAHSFYPTSNHQDISMKDSLLHDFYQSCSANAPYIHARRSSKGSPNFMDQAETDSPYSNKVFPNPTSVLSTGYSVLAHDSYQDCVQNRSQVNQPNPCPYVSPQLTHFLPR